MPSMSCCAGGNKILADVGPWLKDTITARFKSLSLPLTIKYIDPTYMCLDSIDSIAYNHFYLYIIFGFVVVLMGNFHRS